MLKKTENSTEPKTDAAANTLMPYLTAGGTLVIPMESDPKYQWWKGGQKPEKTLAELTASVTG